jgi:hypothetical protein
MGRANHPLPGKSGRMTSRVRCWPAARTEEDVRSVTSGMAVLTAHGAPGSLHRLVRDADRAPLGGIPFRDPRLPGREPESRPGRPGPACGSVRPSRTAPDPGMTQAGLIGAPMIARTAAPERPPAPIDMPAGLAQLHQLARALTSAAVPDGLRVIVTCPTTRFAAAAAALGALDVDPGCDSCLHEQLADGTRVSAYLDGRFTDKVLLHAGQAELDFGGHRLASNRDSVHRLPSTFPERHDHRLDPEFRELLMPYLGCPPAAVGFRHSARCPHPVLVIGEPTAVRDDVAALAALRPDAHLPARLHIGTRLDAWYRHPVLAVGRLPRPDADRWLDEVRPRLVIFAGSAGWLVSWRGRWPDVPQLVLLSRRSPAAAEAVAAIAVAGWAAPEAGILNLPGGVLVPGAGLEIGARCEPCPLSGDQDEEQW